MTKVIGYGIKQTVIFGEVQEKIFSVLKNELLTRTEIMDKTKIDKKNIGNPLRSMLDAGVITIVLDIYSMKNHKYRLTTFGKLVSKSEPLVEGEFRQVIKDLNKWLGEKKPEKKENKSVPPPPPIKRKDGKHRKGDRTSDDDATYTGEMKDGGWVVVDDEGKTWIQHEPKKKYI